MYEKVTQTDVWRRINWPGVIAGMLIIALPFRGMWWKFSLGTNAVVMAISPFGAAVSIFGETVPISPLVWWFLLALKVGVIYLGMLLIIGSVLTVSDRHDTIAKLFVRFSARKLLWLVVAFVAWLLIFIVLANQLPEMLGLRFQLQLPYLVGSTIFSISMVEGVQLTIPISMALTQTFALAVIAATLGFVAWVYQKRFL